jgi:hypothetical protein
VDDLEKTVDELTANGVSFDQHHSGPISTNEKGIAELGDDRVAWFKDPDATSTVSPRPDRPLALTAHRC